MPYNVQDVLVIVQPLIEDRLQWHHKLDKLDDLFYVELLAAPS